MSPCTEDEASDNESRAHMDKLTGRPYFQYTEYFQYDKSFSQGREWPGWYV
jgi:hypothetical protein